jgi:hypothetical protein
MSISRGASALFRQIPKQTRILHITDTEGTSYFPKAIKRSKIVSLSDNGLDFTSGTGAPFFIFGGDATDRGALDLATTQLLVDFKQRYPDNVALLVGNREVKNSRFSIELAPQHIRQRLLYSQQPRWLTKPTSPLMYLKAWFQAQKKEFKNDEQLVSAAETLSIEQCQLIYLRWMLEKTMGCPNTFEYRREELQRRVNHKVDDYEVLLNFMQETSPTGLMGEYLTLGQMGVIVPDTSVLAVHGGLTEFNIGRVPGMSAKDQPVLNAQLWIDTLNAWYTRQIQLWRDFHPTADLTEPACTALDEEVLPIPGKHKSVVTADMLSESRQFKPIPDSVSQYLLANNISVVLTGHQPCGNHPAIVRNSSNNLLCINADTGYAQFDPNNTHDTRGTSGHTLEIIATPNQTSVLISATISNSSSADTTLIVTPNEITGDDYIGKFLKDDYLVQCKLINGNYQLARQEGFEVNYQIKPVAEIESELAADDISPQKFTGRR